jgi:hypothetical protein
VGAAVPEEFILVKPSPEKDPDGSKLDGVLAAQIAIHEARTRRDAWMHLLALTSIPVWFIAAWPAQPSEGARSVVLAAWATCFAVVLAFVAREWRSRRRQVALLEALRATRSSGESRVG